MWSNLHTHSHFCDGKGAPQEYVDAAIAHGMEAIGFSSHAPLPFHRPWAMEAERLNDYTSEIDRLRTMFHDIEIYRGLEIDYIPGITGPSRYAGKLDYTIGSVHFVGKKDGSDWEIDNTTEIFKDGLQSIFGGDIKRAVTRYYEIMIEMLTNDPPDILGHLDKIKVNASAFGLDQTEPWYKALINRVLDTAQHHRTIIEVNTRGIYKQKTTEPYPAPWILEQICAKNISITLSSDAHHPSEVIREFDNTLALVRDIGFTYVVALRSGGWQNVPLSQFGPRR